MNVQKAYDSWSAQYDTNLNKTRDMEALALQETLADIESTDLHLHDSKDSTSQASAKRNFYEVNLSS